MNTPFLSVSPTSLSEAVDSSCDGAIAKLTRTSAPTTGCPVSSTTLSVALHSCGVGLICAWLQPMTVKVRIRQANVFISFQVSVVHDFVKQFINVSVSHHAKIRVMPFGFLRARARGWPAVSKSSFHLEVVLDVHESLYWIRPNRQRE